MALEGNRVSQIEVRPKRWVVMRLVKQNPDRVLNGVALKVPEPSLTTNGVEHREDIFELVGRWKDRL